MLRSLFSIILQISSRRIYTFSHAESVGLASNTPSGSQIAVLQSGKPMHETYNLDIKAHLDG